MTDISEMTYDEWLEHKQRQAEKELKGSEEVHEDEPYFMEFALNRHCFHDSHLLRYIPIYWMSEELLSEHPNVIGIGGHGRILFNKDVWDILDTQTRVAAVYHEMIHVCCQLKGIKAAQNGYHLRIFAQTAEENGGKCTLSENGWTEAYPTEENMKRILKELKQKGVKIIEL